MTIYEAKGFQSNLVYPFDKIEPFQYIERFKPLVVPEGADIEEYKRTQANSSALLYKWQSDARKAWQLQAKQLQSNLSGFDFP